MRAPKNRESGEDRSGGGGMGREGSDENGDSSVLANPRPIVIPAGAIE